jgi:predicted anti-sigma-YlaC factor YlaD
MSGCEHYEELLSAWLDGELEGEDAASLMEHLESCPGCRGRNERFRHVDRMVTRVNTEPGPALEGRIRSALIPKPRDPFRRLLSVAVAALVLIAASLVILVTSDKAAASRAAESLAALDVMHDQALEEQEAILKSFEWQLNALKMEVAHSNLDDQNTDPLLRRIESLLNEIETIRLEERNEKGEER